MRCEACQLGWRLAHGCAVAAVAVDVRRGHADLRGLFIKAAVLSELDAPPPSTDFVDPQPGEGHTVVAAAAPL